MQRDVHQIPCPCQQEILSQSVERLRLKHREWIGTSLQSSQNENTLAEQDKECREI